MYSGCAVETSDGIDIDFRTRTDPKSINRLVNVTDIEVLAGSISACDCYCAIVTGLPEFELKVFSIKTGKLIASQPFAHGSASMEISFNPQNWRNIVISDSLYISKVDIQGPVLEINDMKKSKIVSLKIFFLI